MSQRLSPLGLWLTWEEHEQNDDELHRLLVAQLKPDSQFKHGENLVCAGWPANLLRLAFVERRAWRLLLAYRELP
jgi:hypothetical protein